MEEAAHSTGLRMRSDFEEVDLHIGGEDHNLLVQARQSVYLQRISEGEFDFVPASPPCNTVTRVQFANAWGPCPVRSREYPFGFPWNDKDAQEKCDNGTALMGFGVQALQAASRAKRSSEWRRTRGLLEHPEDLGEAPRGDPASIWQFREPQELELSDGYFRGALYQCEIAEVDYSKPTGLLTDVSVMSHFLRVGWPEFDHSGKRRNYCGPLPPRCSCGRRHQGLARRQDDHGFRTTGTAAWPWGMCEAIATAAVEDWKCRLLAHMGLLSGGDGGDTGSAASGIQTLSSSSSRLPESIGELLQVRPDSPSFFKDPRSPLCAPEPAACSAGSRAPSRASLRELTEVPGNGVYIG